MFIVRFALNALLMAFEVAAVAAVAWIGLRFPFVLAGATVLIALVLGVRLEYMRLVNEAPFYFGVVPKGALMFMAVGTGEAVTKAVLAGLVALITFSGTDPSRLATHAIVFAITLYLGVQALRWLAHRFGARPTRWGFFRLAAPLGLLFSLGLTGLVILGYEQPVTFLELGRKAAFETPPRPNLAQASELLFLFKQWFDATVVESLTRYMSANAARIVGFALSVNVLTGFVLALYACLISGLVLAVEDRLLD